MPEETCPACTTVLVVDDDTEMRYSLERVLGSRGYRVLTAGSGPDGIEKAGREKPEVVFLDNRMEGMGGIEALQHLRNASPRSMVILMTAFGTTQTAIEAMKFGAFDYILKPFDVRKVLNLASQAAQAARDLRAAQGASRPAIDREDLREGLVGASEAMREVFKKIGQVAASDVTVMITGESGTGKELVARCLWRHSLRSDRPFVAVNCAAIPENLIESELFGHEKGSFTGATQQRLGKFEVCDGGTLFLDEIGDMTLATQTKILRAIQEGEIQRVGGSAALRTNVRLLAATNKDLERMVAEKTFREDLYYRLNVMRLRLPPLRERPEDVPQIVAFVLQRLSTERKTRATRIAPEALAALCAYRWPGNVRELENVIQRSAVVAQGDTILVKDLPAEVVAPAGSAREAGGGTAARSPAPAPAAAAEAGPRAPAGERATSAPPSPDEAREERPTPGGTSAEEPGAGREEPRLSPTLADVREPVPAVPADPPEITGGGAIRPGSAVSLEEAYDLLYGLLRRAGQEAVLEKIERAFLERALRDTKGNQVKTAQMLGITRATLRKRIEEYSLKF